MNIINLIPVSSALTNANPRAAYEAAHAHQLTTQAARSEAFNAYLHVSRTGTLADIHAAFTIYADAADRDRAASVASLAAFNAYMSSLEAAHVA